MPRAEGLRALGTQATFIHHGLRGMTRPPPHLVATPRLKPHNRLVSADHKVFNFEEAPNTAAFTCRHVLAGAPILYVSHDSEGDWQFLCGDQDHEGSDCLLVCLADMVGRDATVSELAKMCTGHHAERQTKGAQWNVVDESESFIVACVADPGWSVQAVPAGQTADEPSFAYTIGLFQNYEHPELIVLGLRPELMHSMLNTVGERIKAGERLRPGDRLAEVIDGFDVTLRPVLDPRSFEEHVGYARWFYKGAPFPLFQLVWPDKQARFPGEPGTADAFNRQQPLLP